MDDKTRRRLEGLAEENDGHRLTMDLQRERFDKLRTRHEDGTAPQAIAVFNLFQTPQDLASRMVELADIRPGHSVLEPSAGLGRLLDPILAQNPGRVVACDIAPECCKHLLGAYPGVSLVQGDFVEGDTQTRILNKLDQPEEDSLEHEMNGPNYFDRIVMNPPFKMRRDIKHIKAAIELLAPGGRLVGLCLSGYKRPEFLAEIGAEVETVPGGAFKSEGTNVETLLFTYQL